MNAKSKIKVIYTKGIIEINRVFEKECRNPLSDEYKILQKVRQENTEFVVQIKTISRNNNKKTYEGLTYECMREYILLTSLPGDELNALETFDKLLLLSKRHSKAISYPIVKQWFLNTYPEAKELSIAFLIAAELQRRAEAELSEAA